MGIYALYFGLNLLLELPLYAGLAPAGRRRRALLDGIWINLATHPFLTLAVLGGLPVVPSEIVVIAAETAALRWVTMLPWGRAAAIAVVANVTSASASLLLG